MPTLLVHFGPQLAPSAVMQFNLNYNHVYKSSYTNGYL
jgi:hypothetical protein